MLSDFRGAINWGLWIRKWKRGGKGRRARRGAWDGEPRHFIFSTLNTVFHYTKYQYLLTSRDVSCAGLGFNAATRNVLSSVPQEVQTQL